MAEQCPFNRVPHYGLPNTSNNGPNHPRDTHTGALAHPHKHDDACATHRVISSSFEGLELDLTEGHANTKSVDCLYAPTPHKIITDFNIAK